MSKKEETAEQKEAIKTLRRERKGWIKAAAAKVKGHQAAIRAIREQLKDTPRTVPEIAKGARLPSREVMWYVASLKKFGEILEADQDGGYFRYQLTGGEKKE